MSEPPTAGGHGGKKQERARGELSRRDLLRGRFWLAFAGSLASDLRPAPRAPAPGASPQASPHASAAAMAPRSRAGGGPGQLAPYRPPGALAEPDFLAKCTRCGDCAVACPHGAIRSSDGGMGPAIVAIESPCRMCPDMPCIAACAPGALQSAAGAHIATAKIVIDDCLAHQGTSCSVCREHCPVPGVIEASYGRPTIKATACTGCGVCLHVCPAPHNAIVLMPAPRPTAAALAGVADER